jgi:hypothetical protein
LLFKIVLEFECNCYEFKIYIFELILELYILKFTKMKRNILNLLFLSATILMQLSCTKESEETLTDPLNGLTKLADGYALGASAKVEIWAQKNFFVGYNNLTLVLYDSVNLKEKISDVHILLMPVMTMGMGEMTIQHACPIENPNEIAINEVFPGAIAFTMPTTMDGFWKLGVSVHNHKNDKEG